MTERTWGSQEPANDCYYKPPLNYCSWLGSIWKTRHLPQTVNSLSPASRTSAQVKSGFSGKLEKSTQPPRTVRMRYNQHPIFVPYLLKFSHFNKIWFQLFSTLWTLWLRKDSPLPIPEVQVATVTTPEKQFLKVNMKCYSFYWNNIVLTHYAAFEMQLQKISAIQIETIYK